MSGASHAHGAGNKNKRFKAKEAAWRLGGGGGAGSVAPCGLLHLVDDRLHGGVGLVLLFRSGEVLQERCKGEAGSDMMHARKDEARRRLDNLLPLAAGARRQQLLKGSQLPCQVGE